MATTVWARQKKLVGRLKMSLKHHMEEAYRLQDNQDDLDERNERLTHQTKRSLGLMNSDVQKLETELIQVRRLLAMIIVDLVVLGKCVVPVVTSLDRRRQ